ncbi:MAG: GNAT family N-acetyltransferase [Actinomycetaceae bacterium]|nr:GNAT family N-acetyltransferase [Actinomycetaceae bacterium]
MRWPLRRSGTIRRLNYFDKQAALELFARDPVASVLARMPFEQGYPRPAHAVGYCEDDGDLTAVCWVGANIAPVGFSPAGLDALAHYLRSWRRLASSLVGPADQVMGLWDRIADFYPEPREIRPKQLSMVYRGGTGLPGDPETRPATVGEGSLVVPASIAMFIEEVGYDPTMYGPGYVQRVHSLVRAGHTFVRMGKDPDGLDRVEFKADIGALAGGVAQVQGVWTHPDLRGRGIGSAAMVAVAEQIQDTIAPTVSLYVNDYNLPAVRMYEKIGFETVGHFATVLL